MYRFTFQLTDAAFLWNAQPYPIPVLALYSDTSYSQREQWPDHPEYAQNIWLSQQKQDAYAVHISGAGHMSLTDLCYASPILTRLLDGPYAAADPRATLAEINRQCLAFFDATLKKAGTYPVPQ